MKFNKLQLETILTALINLEENIEIEDFEDMDDPESEMKLQKDFISNISRIIEEELV